MREALLDNVRTELVIAEHEHLLFDFVDDKELVLDDSMLEHMGNHVVAVDIFCKV